MGAIAKLGQLISRPLPQRMSYQDTTNYAAQLPAVPWEMNLAPYQTYWMGNQLPGTFIHTQAHANLVNVRSPGLLMPNFQGAGTYGQVMGQVATTSLVARWHQLWQLASARS